MNELNLKKTLVLHQQNNQDSDEADILGKIAEDAKDLWDKKGFGLKENQLRNFIDIASSSGSVPVLLNFIRYQIGRNSNSRQWQEFGKELIGRLNDCDKIVKKNA